jgi:hypothetical protein
MSPVVDALERFKQPEYTGENRCRACTVVNLLIAGALSGGAGVGVGSSVSIAGGVFLGVSVMAVSVLLIYVRGYLVPKTPELTKKYFPPWLLALFGKDPETAQPTINAIDAETELVRAGALEECEDSDDLCLTAEFRTDWDDEIAQLRENGTDRAQLLGLLDIEERNVEFHEHGNAFQAFVDGTPVGTWESEAAYIADLAAANTLVSYHPNWTRLSIEAKSQLLSGLRLFIEDCPACGGEPTFGADTVESCCSQYEVAAVSCTECDARLFETRM